MLTASPVMVQIMACDTPLAIARAAGATDTIRVGGPAPVTIPEVDVAFEMSGSVQEIGRLGMEWTNADTATRTLAGGGSVTFRNRFPATPSSLTFSVLNANGSFSGSPSSYFADRDGFGFYSYQSMPSLSTFWWFGTYTAVA